MNYIILGIYFVLVIVIAILTMKKVKTVQDFLLGGRKIGPWMSAFAYGTTYFSAVIFVGYAGRNGWNFGISTILIGLGNALVGSLLAWWVLAKRTRRITHTLDIHTMPEFFQKRYNSRNMKIFSAIIIFIFLVPYCASVYQGLSYLFETVFGIPFVYCMIAMALLTAFYLVLGGYIATVVTEFAQGLIMLLGIVLMLGFLLGSPEVGGLAAGISKLAAIDPSLGKVFDFSSGGAVTMICMIVLTSLGTWALPQMVQKFYAIKDDKAIHRGMIISTLFALVVAGGAYFMGSFGRLFLNNTPPVDAATGAANLDMVVPQMLHTAMPGVMMGLIVVLVLAASMSTLSSLVLVSSSAISVDLVRGTMRPNMSAKNTITLSRVLCVLFVLVSFLVALDKKNAIITLMSFSWGTISGAFLGPFLYGLWWKGVTRAGAWAGMIAGVLVSAVLAIAMGLNTAQAPLIGCIAMGTSLVVVPIASLLSKKTLYMPENLQEIYAGKYK